MSFLLRCLPRRPLEWTAACLGLGLALPMFAFAAPLPPLPDRFDVPGSVVLDVRGGVLDRDAAAGMRIPIPLDKVAPAVLAATVAAEDQRFWSHPGVDPFAMGRAAIQVRSNPSGASTITQQLARWLYVEGSPPRALRKAREGLIALALEARTSKEQVLEAYLNSIYYGRGAYGIEAAARVYFGVPAADLDLAQAAFLAGLPRSPSAYDTPEGAAAALERQRYVLDRMVATGALTAAVAADAVATPLRVVLQEDLPARHLAGYVYDELRRVLPAHHADDGLIIETTLDAALQRAAERSVRIRLDRLRDHRAGSAAVVVLDPRDGRLLALVGSADFDAPAGQINMTLEPRQPGSALKPLLYAAALERGYTAASMLLDVPSTFTSAGGPYSPVNYDLRFRGPVSLRVALASSLNVPAVRMLDTLGVDALLEVAHRAGLDSLQAAEAYGLALTLGGGSVRLVDLTAAYGVFATGGGRREPWVIARVRDQAGNVLYERGASRAIPVTSPEVAFLIADMLSDPAAREPGFGAASVLDTALGAAVKTGTSSEFRDNWAVGFTPQRVVGVWVGNPDQAPMERVSGVSGAAPIWRDVIHAASEGLPRLPFTPPPDLVRAEVCAPTGLLPGADCPAPALEWFIAGTEPLAAETYYHRAAGGVLAIDPPVEARGWALAAGWTLAPATAEVGRVAVLHPVPGAVLYPALETGDTLLLLRASAPAEASHVDFFVNGELVGSGQGAAPLAQWALAPGRHELRVVAYRDGSILAEATSAYEVREQ